MRMTNQRYAQLSPEQIKREQGLLEPLRLQHQRELLDSGAAHRIIGSTALSNIYADHESMTEGTWLFPLRRTTQHRSAMQNNELRADLRVPMADLSLRAGPDPLSMAFNGDDSYVLYMGRSDAMGTSTAYRHGLGYVAGISLAASVAEAMDMERLMPVPGVRVEDMKLLDQQLSQIAAFIAEHEIEIIDTVTLEEGHGELRTH